MSGPDRVPGRRRAGPRPFEESATPLGSAAPDGVKTDADYLDAASADLSRAIGGAHSRPPLSDVTRVVSTGENGGAHANAQRPAARPASRAPSIPAGPVLLPPAERPPARPPGSRRADRPTLVGPDPIAGPGGRRIAHPPSTTPAATPPPAPVATAPAAPAPAVPPATVQPAVEAPAAKSEVVTPVEAAPVDVPERAEPTVRTRSRQRTRGWLGDRPSARPAPRPAPRRSSATPRPDGAEPDVEQARVRYAARSRRVGVDSPAAVLPAAVWAWLGVVALGIAGVAAVRLADLPDVVGQTSASVIAVAFALGLAVRTGGRAFWAAGLSAVLVGTATATGWDALLAGASVGTGVLAATLAVMATTPASTFPIAIREALIATAIAAAGGFGVVGFGPQAQPEVHVERFGYVVLGLSLAGAFALVYRLGAGLHGLGRRGYAVAGGAVILLALALAYSEAISQWGSRDLVGSLDDLRATMRSTFGAVAHPIVALLGYPALLWGVFMRARRRQGWWVCAFGVAATAPTATRLVASEVSPGSILLGALYSLVVGIVLGYLVIRAEQSLTGTHGRRARRDEEAVAHRPEPSRTHPLH